MKILTNKFLHILVIIFLFGTMLNAQERIHIKKKEFKKANNEAGTGDEEFKKAWKNIKKANFLFYKHRKGSYRAASELYKQATEYNADNPELNMLLGICYLRSWPKEAALKYVKKAVDSKENVDKKAQFFLARAYHCASKFKDATLEYRSYFESLSDADKNKQKNIIDKYIEECENALEVKKIKVRALIDNAGAINSKYDDYTPVISYDEKKLYFTSRRGQDKQRTNPLNNDYYEDIYESNLNGKNWSEAVNLGKPLNQKWNDAVIAISHQGEKMIIYRGNKNAGDLYSATLRKGKWGNIHDVTRKVNNNKSHESYLCFNQDGTKMYFISNKKSGSKGGKDIYMSELKRKNSNSWTKPVNLGSNINTPYDEVSVCISPDEQTLYFSSNGHNTIGGFDIFKSELKNGEWSKPENMGLPINSPADEIHLNILKNGKDAFYASSRDGGKGGFDIYHVTILGAEKPILLSSDDEIMAGLENVQTVMEEPAKIKYTRMTVVKGTITDFNTGKPLRATIELVNNATGKKERTTSSNKNTGAYLIALPSGKNYGFSVNADGYMFHSENFDVPKAAGYKEILKDVALQPMTAGSKIILYNTFFKSGKSNLRPESFSELNRVAQMFKKYPKLILEISGHTDNRGSVYVNKRLSKARAKAVVDYLVGQGVNPSNLKAVGYYFKFPVASNRTKEGRQQNRRVEAKIISN